MSKFKVGDIIIGNEGAKIYTRTTFKTKCQVVLCEPTLNFSGDIRVEIVEGPYEGKQYWVNPEYFDLYTPHQGKILIMVDEKDTNKIVARDLISGKKAEAKCNPKDEWDFEKGAKLAFSRLYPKPEKKEEKKPWKGDLICVASNSVLFTVGKVYYYDGSHLEDNTPTSWYLPDSDVEQLNEYFSSRNVVKFIEYKGGIG